MPRWPKLSFYAIAITDNTRPPATDDFLDETDDHHNHPPYKQHSENCR
jgi:hypothetical protein